MSENVIDEVNYNGKNPALFHKNLLQVAVSHFRENILKILFVRLKSMFLTKIAPNNLYFCAIVFDR